MSLVQLSLDVSIMILTSLVYIFPPSSLTGFLELAWCFIIKRKTQTSQQIYRQLKTKRMISVFLYFSFYDTVQFLSCHFLFHSVSCIYSLFVIVLKNLILVLLAFCIIFSFTYFVFFMKDTCKRDPRQFSRPFPSVRVQREVKTEICKWNFTSSLPHWACFFFPQNSEK